MRTLARAFALVLILAAAGCGGSGEEPASTGEYPESTSAASSQGPGYPLPRSAPGKGHLEKLVAKDLEVSGGRRASWGDEVTVRYVGVYYDTGKIYSQHWGSSLEFKLDGEEVGVGWQKGIEGMRVGGRRELLIPSDMLFGDGDLAYVVELQKVGSDKKATRSSFASEGPFAKIEWKKGDEKPRFDSPDRPAPTKLLSRDLEAGSGPPAQPGDEVEIFYAGFIYKTGERRYGGTAGPFQLGSGGLGEAFERGLVGMKAGGRRELILPSRFIGGTPAVDYGIFLKSRSAAAQP